MASTFKPESDRESPTGLADQDEGPTGAREWTNWFGRD
jgi:hypothetical protein